MILTYRGKTPQIGKNVFIAPTAVVVGDVEIADGASIWYGAVVRGDLASIRIGHPSGVLECRVRNRRRQGETEIVSGGVMRTARRIMQGDVLVPNRCYALPAKRKVGV